MSRPRKQKHHIPEWEPPRASTLMQAIEGVQRCNEELMQVRAKHVHSTISFHKLIYDNRSKILPKLRELLKQSQGRKIRDRQNT